MVPRQGGDTSLITFSLLGRFGARTEWFGALEERLRTTIPSLL